MHCSKRPVSAMPCEIHCQKEQIKAIKYLQEQLTFDYQSRWWQDYSYLYRHVREWQCEDCQLSFNSDRYYLHVHHRLGTLHNHPKDLRALCIACHSEQPGVNHQKLKTTDDYHTFMETYGGPQWCEARKSVESRVRDWNKQISCCQPLRERTFTRRKEKRQRNLG